MERITDGRRLARQRVLFVCWAAAARCSMTHAGGAERLIELLYTAERVHHPIAIECGPAYVRMFEQLIQDIAYNLVYYAAPGQLWPDVLPILDRIDALHETSTPPGPEAPDTLKR